GQLLDTGLVGDGGPGVRRTGGRLGRIFAARAVDLIQLLSLRVIRLHVCIGDGPGWGDAVMVFEFAKILLAQSVESRTGHLRGAAYEVMHSRLEGLAVLVVPDVGGDVTVVDEHLLRTPVLRLPRHPAAAFEQQDLLAGRRQMVGQGATTRTAANDDH